MENEHSSKITARNRITNAQKRREHQEEIESAKMSGAITGFFIGMAFLFFLQFGFRGL